MKTELTCCCFVITIGATFALGVSALGQDTTDILSKSLDLVHRVETPAGTPPTDGQRIDLLSQAITMAQKAPNHRLKGHRVLAIQAIRSAIAEIRGGDPNRQAAAYLHTADSELGISIELAAANQSSEQSQPPPPVAATPPLTIKMGISLAPANSSPVPSSSTMPPNELASITQVITRLVTNASEKPPGSVEDFVTRETVETVKALSEMMGDKRSLGDALAYTYGAFSLQGPLTCLYSDRMAAIVFGKVKLTPAALKDHQEHPDVSTVETTVGGKVVSTETGPALMFGPGGSSNFLEDKVPEDGQILASFCLIREHETWKVHCVYFSNQPLQGDNKDFIIRQLAEFAKNPSGKPQTPKAVAPVALPDVSYAILHNFGDGSTAQDGENPCGSLVQGSDENLFGVTQELTSDRSGNVTTVFSSGKKGTIFKITPDGKVTVLHIFNPKDPEDGAVPDSSLTTGTDGNLYGAIPGGGENGCGYFFKITTQGVLTPLHQFGDSKFKDDPRGIEAPFVRGSNGAFYGTDDFGGAGGHGSVFEITAEGVVTTLHSFSDGTVSNDGAMCRNPVAFGPDGDLYGTTFSGPLKGTMPDFKGILFKITSDGKYTILHRFADGTIPNDAKASDKVGLVMADDKTLYGTTVSGGVGSGTFFKFTPEGVVTILHVFGNQDPKDAAFPQPTLIEGHDGNFYGTSSSGGPDENGTIYKITPEGTVTILHYFGDGTIHNDGIDPKGGLVLARDGCFYGTTTQGGSAGKGTLFRIKIP